MTTSAPFQPKYMKLSVLTAALQELTPREKRDPDPDLAIEEWLQSSTGKKAAANSLKGAVMKQMRGAARADVVDRVLQAELDRPE